MSAWNRWRHCMSSTYGTWLPGDPRGFRTRGHREHVEGDYQRPPTAGTYEQRHGSAKRLMKRPAVVLSQDARRIVLDAIVHALVEVHRIEMLAVCVSATHMHLLARFPMGQKPTSSRDGLRETDPVRYFVGIAKERSSKALTRARLVQPGGVWAKRGKIVPITDRAHQLAVYRYIVEHERQGAEAWTFKDGNDYQKPMP